MKNDTFFEKKYKKLLTYFRNSTIKTSLTNHTTMIETLERTDLGTSIKPEWKLTEVECFFEKETEKAIQIDASFDFDGMNKKVWIPKSLVKEIKVDREAVYNIVVVPTWWAIKNI